MSKEWSHVTEPPINVEDVAEALKVPSGEIGNYAGIRVYKSNALEEGTAFMATDPANPNAEESSRVLIVGIGKKIPWYRKTWWRIKKWLDNFEQSPKIIAAVTLVILVVVIAVALIIMGTENESPSSPPVPTPVEQIADICGYDAAAISPNPVMEGVDPSDGQPYEGYQVRLGDQVKIVYYFPRIAEAQC